MDRKRTLSLSLQRTVPGYKASPADDDYGLSVREPFIGARNQLYLLRGQSHANFVWPGLLGFLSGMHWPSLSAPMSGRPSDFR
jgi:hypothetical protein